MIGMFLARFLEKCYKCRENTKKKLMRQILDAAGNVLYTYNADWVIVNGLRT